MPCPAPKFNGVDVPRRPMENWALSVHYTADEYFEPAHRNDGPIPIAKGGKPDGLRQLVNVIARATDENKRLKALGSGWGYEDLARPDHWVIKMQHLSQQLTYVIRRSGGALNDAWYKRHFDPISDTSTSVDRYR